MCTSGSDHHAIEVIGHQEQAQGHVTAPLTFAESSIGHEEHPEICTDTPLLSDIPLQRDNHVSSCEDRLYQAELAYPLNDLIAAVSASSSHGWSVPLDDSSKRPPVDDLSSIRLLI
jgi:hypothetical protein